MLTVKELSEQIINIQLNPIKSSQVYPYQLNSTSNMAVLTLAAEWQGSKNALPRNQIKTRNEEAESQRQH